MIAERLDGTHLAFIDWLIANRGQRATMRAPDEPCVSRSPFSSTARLSYLLQGGTLLSRLKTAAVSLFGRTDRAVRRRGRTRASTRAPPASAAASREARGAGQSRRAPGPRCRRARRQEPRTPGHRPERPIGNARQPLG